MQDSEPSSPQPRLQRLRNSKIRQVIWPIRSYELAKFIPMALLMFTILLNQNIVRSIKDSLIMTMVGPEVISYIKLWVEMPIGILFVVVYARMCNVMTTEQAFRRIVIFFLAFFALFGFVLFPYREMLHPDPAYINYLVDSYPHFKWFSIMFGNWTIILVYIMGELWPMIVFTLLFWQLANKITASSEAARFYPFLTVVGQSNCLMSGSIIVYFASKTHFMYSLFDYVSTESEIMLKSLVVIVLFTGVICLIIHSYINKNIIENSKFIKRRAEKKLLKLSIMGGIKMILRSRYLGLLSILLISYSLSVNLIEGIWMYKVKQQYPTAQEFIVYEGKVLFWTGIVCFIFAITGSTIIRKWGWKWAAILTPLAMLIFGGSFFVFVIMEDQIQYFISPALATPLLVIVVVGAIQNIFGKGVKYSLFDSTKEMAYIPLDAESKTKGKAAVDIVGGKIGKSMGAFIQFSTFTIFPMATYDSMSSFLMTFFIFTCLVWTYGVIALSKDYNNLVEEKEEAEETIKA